MYYQPLQFDTYYHIYNRGVNSQNIFLEKRNYPYFLRLYSKYIFPVAQAFAYCLLPNHFHIFIRTYSIEEQEIYWRAMIEQHPFSKGEQLLGQTFFKLLQPSRAFNNMFIAYARAVNSAMGRTGPLFERPFHRKPVTSQSYFQNLIVYIHQNPQKHGIVSDFRDWPYSSFNKLTAVDPASIAHENIIHWFGGRDQLQAAHQAKGSTDFDATNLEEWAFWGT